VCRQSQVGERRCRSNSDESSPLDIIDACAGTPKAVLKGGAWHHQSPTESNDGQLATPSQLVREAA